MSTQSLDTTCQGTGSPPRWRGGCLQAIPSVGSNIYLAICLFIHPSIYLIYLIYPSVYIYIILYIYINISPSISLSLSPSLYLHIHFHITNCTSCAVKHILTGRGKLQNWSFPRVIKEYEMAIVATLTSQGWSQMDQLELDQWFMDGLWMVMDGLWMVYGCLLMVIPPVIW